MSEAIEKLLESPLGKDLADPARWREVMTGAWAKHPDPRLREFGEQLASGTPIRKLAQAYREMFTDGLQMITHVYEQDRRRRL